MSKYNLSQSAQTMIATGSSPANHGTSSSNYATKTVSKPDPSKVAYYNAKNKYGSSSKWYDAALEEEKQQSQYVTTLKEQLEAAQKQGKDRYHLTAKQEDEGKTVNRPWMAENWDRNTKSVEELQKELSAAEAKLKNAQSNLEYATEWRDYDADMAWLDNVNNSQQSWDEVSRALNGMQQNIEQQYAETFAALEQAKKENEMVDRQRRQGGLPTEVGLRYTNEEELAKMEAQLLELSELNAMVSRRYGYSLDKIGEDKKAIERGKLRADHIATMAEQEHEKAMSEYVQTHVKGDTLGAVRESMRNDRSDYMPTDLWSDEQLNRYYALLGSGRDEEANLYAVNVNTYNNATEAEKKTKSWYEWGYAEDANGWGKTARGLAGTAAVVATAPGQLGSYLNKVERVAATGVYTGSANPGLHGYAQALTQGRADSLNELGTIGDKGLGDLYQLTNSMAQSLVYANTVGMAGTMAIFFGQAADQGFDDALARGATGEQASIYGFMSGVAEAAAEYIPLDNLLKADKAMLQGFLKSTLIQAGMEGTEEGVTSVLNTMADAIVNGDKSAISLAVQQRMANGESYDEATRAEWNSYIKDVMWDVVGGAIRGAGSSVIQQGVNMVKPYTDTYGVDAEQLGKEAAASSDEALAKRGNEVQKIAENGGTITNYTAQKMVKQTNRASMVDAVEQQINERGENVKDARMLANAIVSKSRGERVTKNYQALMDKHSELSNTLLQELGGKKTAPTERWAKEIGVRGKDAVKYGDKGTQDMFRAIKKEMEKIDSDAPAVAEADMNAEVSVGEITGTISRMTTENGKPQFAVTDSEGKTQFVDVDEAINSGTLPAGMARLAYESLGLGDAAADVYSLYTAGQNVSDYVAAMDEAINIASEVSKRTAFNRSDAAQELTSKQKDFAWEYGQKQRSDKQQSRDTSKKRKPAKAGTVSFDGAEINGVVYKATSKDKIKAADLRVIERIAKAANVDVVFFESDSIDGKYQGANGFYRSGTIYLDVHAAARETTQQDAILLTAAHELTHHIRLNAEAQYEALQEFVEEHLLENGFDFETMVQEKLKDKGMSRADAVEEVVADACEMVLKDSKAVEKLAKENKTLAETIAEWLHSFYEDIKAAFEGIEARSKEAQAMTEYMDELVKLWDDALIEASKGESKQSGKTKYSFDGYAEDGRGKYTGDYPKGTPKSAKAKDILSYIQNVWSKKPIKLQIWENGQRKTIEAQFDPTYDESTRTYNDASKLMGGNRHGTATEQRVTLDLASDYYKIASEAQYNYSKAETGKATKAHEDVKIWHYFVNGIYFAEHGTKEYEPYMVTINVKEKTDGSFVYSFSAEKEKRLTTLETLHAPGRRGEKATASGKPSDLTVPQADSKVKLSELDRDYFAAVEAGDMETAQRMVKEYAKKAGYTIGAYHGTPIKGITVFDPAKIGATTDDGLYGHGFYFSTDKPTSEGYATAEGQVMPVFLNVGKTWWAKSGQYLAEVAEELDMDERALRVVRSDKHHSAVAPAGGQARQFTAHLQGKGYNSVIVQHGKNNYEIVIFDNKRIKAADAVTYDDNGNVIPLSERFDESNEDIRYSQRDSSVGLTKEEARAQAQAYTKLKAENAALKRKLEYWKGQTKRTKNKTVRRNDVDKYVRELVKMHGSEVDTAELKQWLYDMGDYLVQSEELDYDVLYRMAWLAATEIIENAEAVVDVDAYGDSAAILDDLKSATIKLDPMYKSDLPEGFRKQYRNKLHISYDNGRSVDSVYQNLQEDYGKALFPDMPTQADMLVMMGEAYDTLTAPPEVYNPYRSHMNEAITNVTYDIIDKMLSEDIRQTPRTQADRLYDLKREEAAKRKQAVAEERAAKWDKVDAVKKHYQDVIKRQKESRKENTAAKKYRDSVYDKVLTLTDMLQKNSDKEHIPEALKAPLIDFLSSIDLSSKQKLKKNEATRKDVRYIDAAEAIQNIAKKQQAYLEGDSSAETLDSFLDMGDLADYMQEHRDSIREILGDKTDVETGGVIAYMNAAQLQDLDHILTVLTTSIRKANKFLGDSHYASVIEAAKAGMAAVNSLRGEDISQWLGKEAADKFFAWSNTIPYYAFKRFGEAGSERFAAFITGWSKMAQNIAEIKKYTAEAYTEEEVKAWESTLHEFEFNGVSFKMTEAQIMGLYLSNMREQAVKHIDKGGIRIGNIQMSNKAGIKTSLVQKDTIHLLPSEISEVLNVLTPRHIEVAAKLSKFLNTTCSEWGNEVSMERFGYRQFTEDSYYPIKSVETNMDLKDKAAEETDLFRLINMSATKALNPNANNAILINSVFDIFAAHTADMAKYNGLALPVLDMVKWYNWRDKTITKVTDTDGSEHTHIETASMHKSIEAAFGRNATEYISHFIKDLNGVRSGGRSEGMLKGAMGRYKAAAVALNTRVIVQQPTSIVRASYMINPKYLMRGAAMKGGAEEAMEYSGLAQWKSMGFFDTNIARGITEQIKHSATAIDKLKDKSMEAAGKADEMTWGAIWNACKLEVQEKTGAKGETLKLETAKRFNEIIVATQVMDSTITRSDLMRSDSLMMKELTSFKSEPTVTYNMMLDSVMELILEKKRTGSLKAARQKAWPIMGRAFAVYVTSQLATAAAAAIIDALRDDDEYQSFLKKWLEHVGANFKDNVNPLGLLPILPDMVNVLLGKETPESMLFQPLTQLQKGTTAAADMWKLWFNSDAELNDPRRTNWGRLYQIAQAASSLTGVPVAAGMREAKMLWNMSGRYITGKKLVTYDSGAKNEIKYALEDGYLTEEEAVNLLIKAGEYTEAEVDDAYWQVQEWVHADDSEWTRYNDVYSAVLAGDAKAFEAAVDTLGDHGIPGKSVKSKVKSEVGKWFVGGEDVTHSMDEKTALKALTEFAGMIPIEAQHYLDELKFQKETGVRWADLKAEYVAGTFKASDVKTYLVKYGHEYSKDADEKVKEWTCEKDTGFAYSELSNYYVDGELSEKDALKYLQQYGGLTAAEAETKVLAWDAIKDLGIKLGSSTAGIKKQLIEGYISEETAIAAMMKYDGKTREEAEDYVNQYKFTEETGYAWSEVEEAFADGIITEAELTEWYMVASSTARGSEEIAKELVEVAKWKRDVEGAEKINRDALAKWDSKGEYYMTGVGLGKEDFADAWALYSVAKAQYDSSGNKTKEKAQVFFEQLYALYQHGVYNLDEVKAIAKSIYSSSYIRKYAPW